MGDSIGSQLLAAAILFLITSWIFVGLRCFVRLKLVKSFWMDDWLMIVSLILFSVMCGVLMAAVSSGIGQHTRELDPERARDAFKYQTLGLLFYIVDAITVKLSIGILLLRITQQRRYSYAIFACMFMLVLTNIAMFGIMLFQCKPISYYWDQFVLEVHTVQGTCIDRQIVLNIGYLFSATGIVVDWAFALMPIPMLWGINMRPQVKLSVIVILGLGIFASTATIVRLIYVLDLIKSRDPIYDITHSLIWIVVEMGLGICAACLATLRPLINRIIVGFSTSNHVSDQSPVKSSTRNGYHVHTSIGHELNDINRGRNSIRVESEQIVMQRANAGWEVSNESQEEILPIQGQITKKVDVDVSFRGVEG
ncbi:hypothetical protein BKA64DRAFT_706482 [Cadophora sp. MPI-SDFR-AT-0126]|nr:hypothetical protein BKA64DRAFT_706482 [Leotiomycetes sp. MPI-SDFR-AT-0126]